MPGRQVLAILTGLILAMCAAKPARAQDAESQPLRISRADLDRCIAAIDPAPTQRPAIEELQARCSREFDDAMEARTRLLQWLWSNGSGYSWTAGAQSQELETRISLIGEELDLRRQIGAREIEQKWFDGLRRIVPGHESAIEGLARQRLCDRVMPMMRYLAGGADEHLRMLVERVDPDLLYLDSIAQTLEACDAQLESLLKQLDDHQVHGSMRRSRARTALLEARARGVDATDAINERINTVIHPIELAMRVRKVQERTAQTLLALMPEPHKPAFTDEIHACFHRFLRQDNEPEPEAFFKNTLSKTELTASQRERIAAIRDQYRASRLSETPLLIKGYEIVAGADRQRGFYVQYFKGDEAGNKAAFADLEARNLAWNEVNAKWTNRCKDFIDQANAILDENGGGAATQAADEANSP